MQINFFKTKKSFKKTNFSFNSNFYWGLIVCVAFILAVGSLLFGYYLFMQINKEPVASVENDGERQIIKKERLKQALEYFSLREKKSVEILNSPAPVVDPSL